MSRERLDESMTREQVVVRALERTLAELKALPLSTPSKRRQIRAVRAELAEAWLDALQPGSGPVYA